MKKRKHNLWFLMLISHTMELADLTATAAAESLQRSKEHRYQQDQGL
jgi:hypothetical protein